MIICLCKRFTATKQLICVEHTHTHTHTHTQWLLCLREGRSCTHDVKDKMNFGGTGVHEGGKHVLMADSC